MLADPNTEPTLGEALEFSWHLHKLQEFGQPWEGLSAPWLIGQAEHF